MTPIKNLQEAIQYFSNEDRCRDMLEKMRWPDGKIVCQSCGEMGAYRNSDMKTYKCRNKACKARFSVTVGTVFENTKLPLSKWFTALFILTAHKKGVSSCQIARDIGIGQKAAWFVLHRLREMMRSKENIKLDNIVEVDEVYIGGKVGNMSKTKRTMLRETGQSYNTKTMVMGLIERGGDLKLITVGKASNMNVLQPMIKDNVDKDAVVITDSLTNYTGLNKEFAGHETVNHSEHEYVRDGSIHTNSIEGAFSLLRRSIYGIYHKVTPKHLSRYCDETMFRYNFRKMKDTNRFAYSLQRLEGRLKYKDLIKKEEPTIQPLERNQPIEKRKWERRDIVQIKDGNIIAQYPTIIAAAKANGLNPSHIRSVLLGELLFTGGFQWKYA
jgi:hypothetical protein